MDQIIRFLENNDISFKIDKYGIEYGGYYSFFWISNTLINTGSIDKIIKDIKNNIKN